MTTALLLGSAALAAAHVATAAARRPDTVASEASSALRPAVAVTQRYRVVWQRAATTPGCFFFSGPGTLGRDTHLGEWASYREQDGAVVLDFGGGAVFTGRRTGDRLELARRGAYQFGRTWTTTERLSLNLVNGDLQGSYHYDECEDGAASCPGTCHIDAPLAVLLRARQAP